MGLNPQFLDDFSRKHFSTKRLIHCTMRSYQIMLSEFFFTYKPNVSVNPLDTPFHNQVRCFFNTAHIANFCRMSVGKKQNILVRIKLIKIDTNSLLSENENISDSCFKGKRFLRQDLEVISF